MQFDAASVIGPSWPGSDEGSVDDSFCTALGSGSDADAADVVIVAELQFFCAIIGFTPSRLHACARGTLGLLRARRNIEQLRTVKASRHHAWRDN